MVKWLRHRPFTAVTRVRTSVGSPKRQSVRVAFFCPRLVPFSLCPPHRRLRHRFALGNRPPEFEPRWGHQKNRTNFVRFFYAFLPFLSSKYPFSVRVQPKNIGERYYVRTKCSFLVRPPIFCPIERAYELPRFYPPSTALSAGVLWHISPPLATAILARFGLAPLQWLP